MIKEATFLSSLRTLHAFFYNKKTKTKQNMHRSGAWERGSDTHETNEAEMYDSGITLIIGIADPLLNLDLQNFKWLAER